ncbi:MAG: phosphoglycolate phosphatase [Pyrobaculum sp. OCT_11]|nr:MAG: phosphoglycolate phosphatase [Pyrobaculum sp. OCT_11]
MNCRVLVVDLDGTLTLSRNTYELSAEALLALRRARDAGLRVVLATANGLDFALTIARYLGIRDVVAENGCLIYLDGETHELCSGDMAAVDKAVLATGAAAPSPQNKCRKYDLAYIPLAEDAVGRIAAAVGSNYVVESSGYAIHVRPAGVDKGTAVRWLCERLGVPCFQVAAVGDSDVDVGMLKTAWGIAVGNATGAAKKAARAVVEGPSGVGFREAVDLILSGGACSP